MDPLLCARFQTGYRVLLNPNDSSGQIQMNEVTQMPVTGTGIKGKGAAILFKTCCASTIKRRFNILAREMPYANLVCIGIAVMTVPRPWTTKCPPILASRPSFEGSDYSICYSNFYSLYAYINTWTHIWVGGAWTHRSLR